MITISSNRTRLGKRQSADQGFRGLPVSRRLIDFASGLCYGLNGSMEKVATGVYLLKPPAIRIDD